MGDPAAQAHKSGFCGSCGSPLAGERFCPECGAATAESRVTTLTPRASESWSASAPASTERRSSNWVLIAAYVLAGLFAVTAAAIFVVKSGAVSRANETIAARNGTIVQLNARISSLNSENQDLKKQNNDLTSSNQGLTDSNNTLRAAAQACQDATQKTQDVLTGLNELFNGTITYDQELALAQAAGQAADSCNSYFSTTVGG